MFDEISSMFGRMSVPPGRKSGVACVLGLLFGGIGLAIYLRNVVDFVLPILMSLILLALLGADIGWVGGALFAGVYGYFRVELAAKPQTSGETSTTA